MLDRRFSARCLVGGGFLLLPLALCCTLAWGEAGDASVDAYDDAPEAYGLLPNRELNINAAQERQHNDPYQGPVGYRQFKPKATPKKKQSAWKTALFGAEPEPPPPPKVETFVNVGPRQPPPSPEPLCRLPVAIVLPTQQVLEPTFYLVQTEGLVLDVATGSIAVLPHHLLLLAEGKPVLRLPLSSLGATPSPIRSLPTPATSDGMGGFETVLHRKLSTLLSVDGRHLKFRYQIGNFSLETPSLPTHRYEEGSVWQGL